MAITVQDIQEKVFPTQATGGYDVERVDDFLDEIAEQLGVLVRENLQLKQEVSRLQGELSSSQSQLSDAIAKTPDYNEEGYFRNLQSAMRDSLISAQRVADEATNNAKAEAEKTLVDAKAEAERLVGDAQANAEEITSKAQAAAEAANAEFEKLKSAADSYRANFRKLLEEQLSTLNASDLLFK
ncbi:MAG: DivIVA domain-containing protein [Clostridia bacterium]|nr:DivIVA domain-containing protein [Clostridia bacterium]MBQ8972237.1 DivIVA domain-containing protein [Clostridia bacterium]